METIFATSSAFAAIDGASLPSAVPRGEFGGDLNALAAYATDTLGAPPDGYAAAANAPMATAARHDDLKFLLGNFGYESIALGNALREKVDRALEKARGREIKSVIVVGYSDNFGSRSANNHISLERAEAVKRYLASQGIPAERIYAEGMGAAEPIDTNSTADGRARNRRVEFTLRLEPRAGAGPAPRLAASPPPAALAA